MLRSILIAYFMLMAPTSSYAGIEKLIKNIMPDGTMSNVSRAAIIEEQSAGHLIGGSIVIKTPANPDLQLMHVTAPSCKYGGLPCGAAFEIIGGGVSVIKGMDFMNHLKSLAHNAGAYGGMMAIKTLCPQCEDLMAWLDAKADWLNSIAKTDCEDMARLAGGAITKAMASSRALKQSASILAGEKKDITQYARDAKSDTEIDLVPELKSELGENYNLVWKALHQKTQANGDNKLLKEMLMSISGTIIGRKDPQGRRSVVHKRSLLSKDMIEEFMGNAFSIASDMHLYKCDDDLRCLNPTITKTKINSSDTIMSKISTLLMSITKKIQQDSGSFTKEEETLIALASLPLITKIEMDLASYSSVIPFP